jgi:hypothetical protein
MSDTACTITDLAKRRHHRSLGQGLTRLRKAFRGYAIIAFVPFSNTMKAEQG